jgi:streptogramin lyase
MYALLFTLALLLTIPCGAQGTQIDPGSNIRWPINCNATGMVYSYFLDTCISASNGSGGGTGLVNGLINAKDAPYSAKGDGTTDDTAAINAAIGAAQTANKALYIPAGVYKATGQLTMSVPIWIEGAGPTQTVIENYGATNDVFRINYTILGTSIDTALLGAGLRNIGILQAPSVLATAGCAVHLGSPTLATPPSYSTGAHIENVSITGSYCGLWIENAQYINWFKDIMINEPTGHGIYYDAPLPGGDDHINDVEIRGIHGDVFVNQSDTTEFTNLKTNFAGIHLAGGAHTGNMRFTTTSVEGDASGNPACAITSDGPNVPTSVLFDGLEVALIPSVLCNTNGADISTINVIDHSTNNATNVTTHTVGSYWADRFGSRVGVNSINGPAPGAPSGNYTVFSLATFADAGPGAPSIFDFGQVNTGTGGNHAHSVFGAYDNANNSSDLRSYIAKGGNTPLTWDQGVLGHNQRIGADNAHVWHWLDGSLTVGTDLGSQSDPGLGNARIQGTLDAGGFTVRGAPIGAGQTPGTIIGTYPFSQSPLTNDVDASGNVWIGGNQQNVVALSPNGSVLHSYTLSLEAACAVPDAAGFIWVCNQTNNTVTKMTTGGTVVGTYATGSSPDYIQFDHAGNAWVTDSAASVITVLSPLGTTVATYSVGAGNNPWGGRFDAYGNFWTWNYNNNNISKLSPSGVLLGIFPVGTNPQVLGIDPAGNVWVPNAGSGTVTKLSPSGAQILVASIPGTPVLGGLVIDGGGYVWVYSTTSGVDNVYRLDSAGNLLGTFPVGHHASFAAVDGSGNLWVTNFTDASVTKIATGVRGVLTPTVAAAPPLIPTSVATLASASSPVFSPVAGTYTTTQNVAITCSAGAPYYTTNGTTVSAYSTPIAVSTSATITAGCYGLGYATAAVVPATYTISSTAVSYTGNTCSSSGISCTAGAVTAGQSALVQSAYSGTVGSAVISLAVSGVTSGSITTVASLVQEPGLGEAQTFLVSNMGVGTPTFTASCTGAGCGSAEAFTAVVFSRTTGSPANDGAGSSSVGVASSSNPIVCSNITTTASNELLVAFAIYANANQLIAGTTPQVMTYIPGFTVNVGAEYGTGVTAGTNSAQFTLPGTAPNTASVCQLVALK